MLSYVYIDAVPRIYDDVSDLLATCQIAAFIEPINAAFKLVHTGVFAPLAQVGGYGEYLNVLI